MPGIFGAFSNETDYTQDYLNLMYSAHAAVTRLKSEPTVPLKVFLPTKFTKNTAARGEHNNSTWATEEVEGWKIGTMFALDTKGNTYHRSRSGALYPLYRYTPGWRNANPTSNDLQLCQKDLDRRMPSRQAQSA